MEINIDRRKDKIYRGTDKKTNRRNDIQKEK